MNRGFSLGRLFGIQLLVDPSWLLVFALMIVNLTAVFGASHPGWTFALRVFVAIVAALLFFGSVIVHELAHALVAMAHGMRVRDITLFLFGGVSNIEHEPPSPRAEFLMAIAGPIASVALGIAALVAGALVMVVPPELMDQPAALLEHLGPVATLLFWLGPVNIVVGLFNLIPGFPLDGGRVLRAALWAATRDLSKATRWSTQVAQAIGWSLVLIGVAMVFGVRVPVLGQGAASGLWLAFIGWFLQTQARASYERVAVEDRLRGVSVARLMRRSWPSIASTGSVATLVADRLMLADEHAVAVTRGEEIVGLVTREDVRKVPVTAWDHVSVVDVMTPASALVTAAPDGDVVEALRAMAARQVQQLPVMSKGTFCGLLHHRDIVRWLELAPRTDAAGASVTR